MSVILYDSTTEEKYYAEYIRRKQLKLMWGFFAGIVFIFGGLIPIFYPTAELNGRMFLPYLVTSVGLLMLFTSSLSIMKYKKILETGKIGVIVDGSALEFLGDKVKRFEYKDIDFVFVDSNDEIIVVKSVQTPKINGLENCLNKPKKFLSLIPWRERNFNMWDAKIVPNMDGFLEILKGCDIKIYYRKKGQHTIREVK